MFTGVLATGATRGLDPSHPAEDFDQATRPGSRAEEPDYFLCLPKTRLPSALNSSRT
jgi:hypothetical protein